MTSHIEAMNTVNGLVPDSPQLALLTRVVGLLESGYGTSAYRGADGARISDTHNWGGITGSYQGQSFTAVDSRYDAKAGKVVQYSTKFRVYPDDSSGAADLAHLLQTKYSAAVAAVPDWHAVSQRLYGYYLGVSPTVEGSQLAWQKRAEESYNKMVAATGETRMPLSSASATPNEGTGLLLVAAVVVGGIWLLRRLAGKRLKAMR